MLAFLEIVRAAFLSLARWFGAWLLGFSVVWFSLHAILSRIPDHQTLVTGALLAMFFVGWVALVALIGLVLPIVAGMGMQSLLRGGPLALADRGDGYLAVVGYGIGAGLLVAPFAVAMALSLTFTHPELVALYSARTLAATFTAAWLGASAGRIVKSAWGVFALSWLAGALLFAVTVGVSTSVELAHLSRTFQTSLVPASVAVFTQLLVLVASRIDRRSPAVAGR